MILNHTASSTYGLLVENGNVGIGTTEPAGAKLTIYDNTGGDISFLKLRHGADYGADLGVNTNVTGDFFINTVIAGAPTKRLTIQRANGYVGIGTPSPAARLDVEGEIRAGAMGGEEGGQLQIAGSGTNNKAFYIDNLSGDLRFFRLDQNTGVFNVTVTNYGGGTSKLNIYGDGYFSGNVGIGTTTPGIYKLNVNGVARSDGWNTGSDIRLKENITPLSDSLEKVIGLRGVNFNRKGDDKKQIGFIAQEVESIFPEVVSTNSDGYKSMSYDRLTAVLVEAVKEQQREIEELKLLINK
jgi:hypothetical protein